MSIIVEKPVNVTMAVSSGTITITADCPWQDCRHSWNYAAVPLVPGEHVAIPNEHTHLCDHHDGEAVRWLGTPTDKPGGYTYG